MWDVHKFLLLSRLDDPFSPFILCRLFLTLHLVNIIKGIMALLTGSIFIVLQDLHDNVQNLSLDDIERIAQANIQNQKSWTVLLTLCSCSLMLTTYLQSLAEIQAETTFSVEIISSLLLFHCWLRFCEDLSYLITAGGKFRMQADKNVISNQIQVGKTFTWHTTQF